MTENPFALSATYFPTPLQQTVFTEKYSRWDHDLGRRETWIETVARTHSFLRELSGNRLAPGDYAFIEQSTLELSAMPSMRALAMAGEAARRQNIGLYNCAALPLSDLRAFAEVMLLSMNGTGVGYSVERHFVNQLPRIARKSGMHVGTFYIEDSTEGWVEALILLLDTAFAGHEIDFSYDYIRPAGAILRVKGGRASGPAPLREAFGKITDIIERRRPAGYLRPIDALDIACWIASASISGGVRRSAMLALFDAGDQGLLDAKKGDFWTHEPQRMYVNISAVIGNDTPEQQLEGLLRQMDANNTGEPGLFNREGVNGNLPARREKGHPWLTNPCGCVM